MRTKQFRSLAFLGRTALTIVGGKLNRSVPATMTGIDQAGDMSAICAKIGSFIRNMGNRLFCTRRRPFTVSVEGNIGSGKTELLKYFAESQHVVTHTEPVKKWQNVGGENALGKMYEDPSRWSLTFQTYVQLTMLETHLEKQRKPVKMMERSIYSARYCFVENLHKSGVMPSIEYIILNRWFEWIIKNEDCHVDLIVYIRTCPEMVYERIKERCRREERNIELEYLKALHEYHEDWLIRKKSFPVPAPVLILNGNHSLCDMKDLFEENKSMILNGYS